jgi:hypothetical protein
VVVSKVAVTEVGALRVTVQVGEVEQPAAPDHEVKTEPVAGEAVRRMAVPNA